MTAPIGGDLPPAPKVPLRDPEWWFPQALSLTLSFEGDYEPPDPTDPGAQGGTDHGVTQVTYDRERRAAGLPEQDVRLITTAEVQSIYRRSYWLASHAPDLVMRDAGHLACCHFDGSVNHGLTESAKLLQRVVKATADGQIGPLTLQAVEVALGAHGEAPVVYGYLLERRDLYRSIIAAHPDRAKWLPIWMRRLKRLAVAHLGADWVRDEDWT